SLVAPLDALDWSAIDSILAELTARGRAVLREGGVADAEMAVEIAADMRYAGQGFEVTVPLDTEALARHDGAALHRLFNARYEQRFSRNLGALAVEVVSWRVRLVAAPAVTEIRFTDAERERGNDLIEHRPAWFEELSGFVDTPVHARARLQPGQTIAGPALIEEAESTAVIGP